MRTKLTLVFICLCFTTFAQWKPTNGLFSGEIHSVIKSNNEIIVGTKYIYKSTDNGKTWFVSNNGISGTVTSIHSLVKSSSNLVAGTDAGVFYSADNGNNWVQSAGTTALSIYCMVSKGTSLFLSTANNGVYKSTNNGQNWSAVNSGITTITDMRSLAVKGSDIYAGTDGYGIYKSTNDGTSWALVNTGLPGSYYTVSALAIVGNNILAGTYGAGIYKSTNDGSQWNAVNTGVSSTDDILAMAVNGTSIYASTLTGNLYKSTDYSTWNAISPGNFTVTRYEAFYSATGVFYTGCWGFGSPEQSYGLFSTSDDGNTWKHIGITDYPVSVIEVSGNNIIAGTNDITGNSARIPLFKTTEADSTWSFNIGGFAGKNITSLKSNGATMYLFDNEGPGSSLVYRSTNNGNNWTSTGYNVLYSNFVTFAIAGSLLYAGGSIYQGLVVQVSADNGSTWNPVNGGSISANNVYALALKGTLLFAATDNGIYKNTVGSNSWTAVSNGLTNLIIKSIYISGTTIYAGTQGGGIFKSTNDGAHWTEANSGIPLYTNITCFTSSGINIFAGSDHGVFSKTSMDSIWTSIDSGLIDTSVTVLTASTNYLWAGTSSQGVWRRQLTQIITGITEVSETSSFSIFPNPASDNINIETDQNVSIEILNMEGQIIKSIKQNKNNMSIDISDYSRGMYLIKVKTDKGILIKKFVKE